MSVCSGDVRLFLMSREASLGLIAFPSDGALLEELDLIAAGIQFPIQSCDIRASWIMLNESSR